MIPADLSLQSVLSLSVGLILGLWALSKVIVMSIIKTSDAYTTVQKNKQSLKHHVADTNKRFDEINTKLNNLSEKIDKIYTILIDK